MATPKISGLGYYRGLKISGLGVLPSSATTGSSIAVAPVHDGTVITDKFKFGSVSPIELRFGSTYVPTIYVGSTVVWHKLEAFSARMLIVAGGGGGGDRYAQPGVQSFQANGGGGAAGGVLDTTVTIGDISSLTITVGAGGAGSVRDSGVVGGTGGTSSVVSDDGTTINLTRAGGGAGGGAGPNWTVEAYIMRPSAPGGGGGATRSGYGFTEARAAGAAGNGVTLAGGTGRSSGTGSGGGGGNGTAGYDANDSVYPRKGGLGVQSDITGTSLWYGGGGSGGRHFSSADTGTFPREGGGGNGGEQDFTYGSATGVTSGTDGTGGGGGGCGGDPRTAGETHDGGDGIVIIKFPTAFYSGDITGDTETTIDGAYTIVKWSSSGSYTR